MVDYSVGNWIALNSDIEAVDWWNEHVRQVEAEIERLRNLVSAAGVTCEECGNVATSADNDDWFFLQRGLHENHGKAPWRGGGNMIYRTFWFFKMWLAITPMLWRAAFDPNAEMKSDESGFSIFIGDTDQ